MSDDLDDADRCTARLDKDVRCTRPDGHPSQHQCRLAGVDRPIEWDDFEPAAIDHPNAPCSLTIDETAGVVHVVSNLIVFEGRQRQRCVWCGTLIVDDDLTAMAWALNEDGSDPGPPGGWESGRLVEISGGGGFRATHVLDPVESETHPGEFVVPANACLRLDPTLTGSTT